MPSATRSRISFSGSNASAASPCAAKRPSPGSWASSSSSPPSIGSDECRQGLVLQYPIGWLSDRLDRRKVIFGTAVMGALACGLGWIAGGNLVASGDGNLWPIMAAAFFAGGMTTPLYALLLAYTNGFLSAEDMPAASGGLVLHLRTGRDPRPAADRLGDGGARTQRLLAGHPARPSSPWRFMPPIG